MPLTCANVSVGQVFACEFSLPRTPTRTPADLLTGEKVWLSSDAAVLFAQRTFRLVVPAAGLELADG